MIKSSIALVAMIPDSILIESLKKDIEKYEKAFTGVEKAEFLDELQIKCLIVATKRMVPNLESVEEVSDRFDSLEKLFELLDGGIQN